VYSGAKAMQKLHYMHANPVREKLVAHPGEWPWSSWSFYYRGEGLIEVDSWTLPAKAIEAEKREGRPTLCQKRKG